MGHGKSPTREGDRPWEQENDARLSLREKRYISLARVSQLYRFRQNPQKR